MKTHRSTALFCMFLGLTIGLVFPASNLRGAVIIGDSHGISGFELYRDGAIWWRNQGICSGEFAVDSRVNTKQNFDWDAFNVFNVLESGCTVLPDAANNAARDAAYIYLFKGGQLWKKALNATTNDVLQSVFSGPVNLPAGQNGSFLLHERGWLFWGAYTSGTGLLEIKKAKVDGTGGQNVTTIPGAGAPIRRMKIHHYASGGESLELFVILLTNGKLYTRLIESPTSAVQTLQATGISDFALDYSTNRGDELTPQLLAAQGTTAISQSTQAGRLLRINVLTSVSTTIFQATGQNQVLAVEVDPAGPNTSDNVYLTLGIVSGSPIPLVGELALYRNQLPGNDGTWAAILLQDAGTNLRSNGKRLYYLRDDKIVDISTEAPPVMLDFQALGLEVTQFLQDLDNHQPLIANKVGTYARAYATLATNTTPFTNYFPTARLRVWVDGNELPESPFSPINKGMVTTNSNLAVQRDDLDSSFLFKLPKLPVGLLTASFTVNPNHTILETGNSPYGNNAIATSGSISVLESATPCLVAVPVPTPFGKYDTWFSSFPGILKRAESMLPVEKFDVRFWGSLLDGHDPLSGNTYFTEPFGGVNSDDEQDNEALDAIDCLRENSNYPAGCDLAHWVGMVHPGVDNFGGLGRRPGRALVASMSGNGFTLSINDPTGGEILAHELGHNYGLQHINCSCGNGPVPKAPNLSYPGAFCTLMEYNKPGYWAFDPITQREFGLDEAADLMSYACKKWPSTYTWNYVYNQLLVATFLSTNSKIAKRDMGTLDFDPLAGTDPVVFLSGTLNTNIPSASFGVALQLTAQEFNITRIEQDIMDSEREFGVAGHIGVRMLDLPGNVLLDTGLPLEETTDGPDELFAFTHYFPFPTGTRRIQIVRGNVILGERLVSANPPQISLTSLNVDSENERISASWQASDPDGGPVVFWIYYSPDNGASWQALALNRRQTSVIIDTHRLPASNSGRLRVVASDGLRATAAISSAFPIPNHTPEIGVAGLAEGARIPFDQRPSLSVFAVDAEDGRASLGVQWWIQKINGPTLNGAGNDIAIEELEIGEHELTVEATDRDNLVAQITRRFEILPPTIRDGAEPELDGACADFGYEAATVLRIPTDSRGKLPVRFVHATNRLYVSFADLEKAVGRTPSHVAIRFNIDGDGSVLPQTGDRGFVAYESGDPEQEIASGGLMQTTLQPSTLYEAVVAAGESGWSAEMQIDESLLGGWDHLARVMIEADGHVWPANAAQDSPATWAPVWLGVTPPPPTNRAPKANAGVDQLLSVGTAAQVVLNGENSSDPDGDSLSFSWSQTAGPSVALSDPTDPTPTFELSNLAEPVEVSFALTVADAQTTSLPDEVKVTVVPSASFTPSPPLSGITPDGTYSGHLEVTPRTLNVIQATTDFRDWINIRTNTADAFGILDFIDSDSLLYPYRFYRGTEK